MRQSKATKERHQEYLDKLQAQRAQIIKESAEQTNAYYLASRLAEQMNDFFLINNLKLDAKIQSMDKNRGFAVKYTDWDDNSYGVQSFMHTSANKEMLIPTYVFMQRALKLIKNSMNTKRPEVISI